MTRSGAAAGAEAAGSEAARLLGAEERVLGAEERALSAEERALGAALGVAGPPFASAFDGRSGCFRRGFGRASRGGGWSVVVGRSADDLGLWLVSPGAGGFGRLTLGRMALSLADELGLHLLLMSPATGFGLLLGCAPARAVPAFPVTIVFPVAGRAVPARVCWTARVWAGFDD